MSSSSRRWRNPNELVKVKKKKVSRSDSEVSSVAPKRSLSLEQQQKQPSTDSSQPPTKKVKLADESEPTNPQDSSASDVSSLHLPVDWSLKSKLRFTSQQSFSWLQTTRAHQEAAGIVAFTKGQGLPEDAVSAFHHSLLYWVHPSMSAFRTTSLEPTKYSGPPSLDVSLTDALKDDWIVSFQSVFQLLKAGLCPYFYVCGSSFSLLFQQGEAFLTPSTSGLRLALQREGVEFTMPLVPSTSQQNSEATTTDSDNEDDELSASSWLHSIGLPDSPARQLTTKIASQQKAVDVDSRPESTVHVTGGHNLVALCNFLINCRTLIPSTGPYAGLPPTLLAPTAFRGATLDSLKVKHSSQQEMVGREMKQGHCLEVSGPVTPNTFSNLCKLFTRTQHGSFSVHLNTIRTSTSYNQPPNVTLNVVQCSQYMFTWK